MNSGIVHSAAAVVNRLVPFSATVLLHTTVLLSVGLALCRLIRNRGAVAQSLVLKAFLVCTIACPLFVLIGSHTGIRQLRMPVPVEVPSVPQPKTASGADVVVTRLLTQYARPPAHNPDALIFGNIPGTETAQASGGILTSMLHGQYGDTVSRYRLSKRSMVYLILCMAWLVASLLLLGRFVFGLIHLWVLRFRAGCVDPTLQRAGEWIASRYAVNMPPMLKSDGIRSPLLTGILRPVVMLPRNIRITADVIVHELGHYINRDCIWNLLTHAAIILFPVQPLLHVLSKKLEDVNDYVCDDLVVTACDNPRAYALELVSYAERLKGLQPDYAAGVGVMSRRSTLRCRVERIIALTGARKTTASPHMLVMVMFSGLIMVSAAALVGFEAEVGMSHIVSAAGHGHEEFCVFCLTDVVASSVFEPVSGAETSHSVPEPMENTNIATTSWSSDVVTQTLDTGVLEASMMAMAVDENSLAPEEPVSLTSDMLAEMTEADMTDTIPQNSVGGVVDDLNSLFQDNLSINLPDEINLAASIEPDAICAGPDVSVISDDHPDTIPDQEKFPDNSGRASAPVAVATYIPPQIVVDLTRFTDYKSCMKAGRKYIEETQYFTANALFRRAAGFKPNDVESNFHIAKSYLLLKDYERAKMFFQITVAIDSRNPEAYYLLGDTIRQMGDYDAAMKQYKIAYNIDPGIISEREAIFF